MPVLLSCKHVRNMTKTTHLAAGGRKLMHIMLRAFFGEPRATLDEAGVTAPSGRADFNANANRAP